MASLVPAFNGFGYLSSIGDTLDANRQQQLALANQQLALANQQAQANQANAVFPGSAPVVQQPANIFQQVLGGLAPSQAMQPQPQPQAQPQAAAPLTQPRTAAGQPTPAQAAAYGTYTGLGATPDAAKAIVAGLSTESGPNLSPAPQNNAATDRPGVLNPNGAYGVASWNGPRQAQLLNFARQQGIDPSSPDTQHQFVAWDLQHNFPQTWQMLNDPNTSAPDKLAAFINTYENPANKAAALANGMPHLANAYGAPAAAPNVQLAGAVPTPDTAPAPGADATDMPVTVPGFHGTWTRAKAAQTDPNDTSTPDAADVLAAQRGQSSAVSSAGTPSPSQAGTIVGNGSASGATTSFGGQNYSTAQINALINNKYTHDIGVSLLGKMVAEAKANTTTTVLPDQYAAAGIPSNFQGVVQKDETSGKLTLTPVSNETTKWSVIGKDKFGGPIYGYPPAPGSTAANAASTAAVAGNTAMPTGIDPTITGPAVLDGLDPATKATAVAMIQGRANYPSGRFLTTPQGQQLAQAVTQADPQFETGNAANRVKTWADFTSGKTANAITAGNTALLHLGELKDIGDQLNNLDTGLPGNNLLNSARNALDNSRQDARSALLQSYDSINQKFSAEVEKFYAGSGTQSEREADVKNLSSDLSPTQMKAVMSANATALGSKISALQDRWRTGMGPLNGDFQLIGQRQQAVMKSLGVTPPDQSQASPLSAPSMGQQGNGGGAPASTPQPAAAPATPAGNSRIPLPQGYTPAMAVQEAKKEIAAGRDPNGVAAILEQHGIPRSYIGM